MTDVCRQIAALRRGDERVFKALVEEHHAALVRMARYYVRDAHIAEEVAQEAWLGALRGLDSFAGQASFKTWLFSIAINLARTRAKRERRSTSFSAVALAEAEVPDPAVAPEFFRGAADDKPGFWKVYPGAWGADPERALLGAEAQALVKGAIGELPEAQRAVIELRDVQQWTAEEVCNALEITQTNQRVLLHRARSKIRRALAAYFEDTAA